MTSKKILFLIAILLLGYAVFSYYQYKFYNPKQLGKCVRDIKENYPNLGLPSPEVVCNAEFGKSYWGVFFRLSPAVI